MVQLESYYLKKTDKDLYAREAEESFALLELPSSCSTGEPLFRKILNSSPKYHILNLTETAKWLIIEKCALRSSSSSDLHMQELDAQFYHNIKTPFDRNGA